jgi:hypothetical protein
VQKIFREISYAHKDFNQKLNNINKQIILIQNLFYRITEVLSSSDNYSDLELDNYAVGQQLNGSFDGEESFGEYKPVNFQRQTTKQRFGKYYSPSKPGKILVIHPDGDNFDGYL